MQPFSRLGWLRWRFGALLCGGQVVEATSSDGSVVVRLCENCGRVAVDAAGYRGLARRPEQLPELLSQMESYLSKRGHYGEASEVRLLAAQIEVRV